MSASSKFSTTLLSSADWLTGLDEELSEALLGAANDKLQMPVVIIVSSMVFILLCMNSCTLSYINFISYQLELFDLLL